MEICNEVNKLTCETVIEEVCDIVEMEECSVYSSQKCDTLEEEVGHIRSIYSEPEECFSYFGIECYVLCGIAASLLSGKSR